MPLKYITVQNVSKYMNTENKTYKYYTLRHKFILIFGNVVSLRTNIDNLITWECISNDCNQPKSTYFELGSDKVTTLYFVHVVSLLRMLLQLMSIVLADLKDV